MSRCLFVLQPSAVKQVYRACCLVQGEQGKKEPIVVLETFTLGSQRGFATFLCRKWKLTLLRERYS